MAIIPKGMCTQTNTKRAISQEQRIEWIDILKGIAILLVVVGHMEYAEGSSNPGKTLIYSFHMALFFMLSGYTAALSVSRHPSLGRFIWRRFLSVMVPYICWMLAIPVIYVPVEQISQYSVHEAIYGILSGWGQWWFLPCLFILQLFYALFNLMRRHMPGNTGTVIGFAILAVGVFALNRFGGPFLERQELRIHYLLQTFRMFLPFCLGVALFEYPRAVAWITRGRLVPALALAVWCLLCRDYAHFHPFYGRILTGLAGCIILVRLFSGMRGESLSASGAGAAIWRQFKLLGRNSMAIYVLSYLLTPKAPLITDGTVPQLAVFCANLLLGVMICYACVGLKATINVSPLLSAAFLGEYPKHKRAVDTTKPEQA